MEDNDRRIATEVLDAIGGPENVASAAHCMTRLRLNLRDQDKADLEKVKGIKGVLGVMEVGKQTQIIIGQNVPKVYDAFCAIGGIARQDAIDENLDEAPKKRDHSPKAIGGAILDYMSSCMTPLIPVMITAAMFRTVMMFCGPTMLNLIQEGTDLYTTLSFLYDSFFYFLPIYTGYTAAKKVGVNPLLGMYAGAMLVVPGFVTVVENGEPFTIFGIPCMLNDYSQTILPAIISVWIMGYVYRFVNKIMPEVLSTIFTPFVTMVIMVPIEFCAIAPIGSVLGNLIGALFIAASGMGGIGNAIVVVIVSGLWTFLVLSGMHLVLAVFTMNNLLTVGVDFGVMIGATGATWGAYGLALGAFLRLRNKDDKALALGYFISGFVGGVTEPTLYGIAFKYRRCLLTLILGGAIGGLYGALTHVGFYLLGPSGFLSIVSFISDDPMNLVNGVITCVISMLATAALTYFFGFTKEEIEGAPEQGAAAIAEA
ncbi:MAG: PTS transporter subunit EIIC [Tractidigestivibacter sp.]|jgi:PTS system beta-glucosides-specific IIC component|uniref:PTS transporter subunit EIIC n=1 Tax=Tractidigestivibacter sp. TaxID=2847320 RepID=UPI003D8F5040